LVLTHGGDGHEEEISCRHRHRHQEDNETQSLERSQEWGQAEAVSEQEMQDNHDQEGLQQPIESRNVEAVTSMVVGLHI
jgi:hypothetical protein